MLIPRWAGLLEKFKTTLTSNSTYYDSLITITADEIVFAGYYFPRHTPKAVLLADIAGIGQEATEWYK